MFVNGTAAGDTINVVDGASVDGVGTTQVNSPSFELLNLGNKTNLVVNAGGGVDAITLDAAVAPSGLATVTLNGEADGEERAHGAVSRARTEWPDMRDGIAR